MPTSERDSDVYARNLLPKGHGYPMWSPQPLLNLPAAYQSQGVSIGDVGLITENGSFDYLFNICQPENASVNCNNNGQPMVPENFEQVALEESDCLFQLFRQAKSYFSSTSMVSKALNASLSSGSNPVVPVGAAAGIEFSAVASEGAILYLPEDAYRTNLSNFNIFREQAFKHARGWYYFVKMKRGRRSGSLYLVTGCDKSPSWGVASFFNKCGGEGATIRLITQVAQANASYSHTWEIIGSVDHLSGPTPPNDHGELNQTVFIRGFKIALRDGLSAKFKGSLKLEHENKLEKPDPIPGGSIFQRALAPFFNGGGSSRLGGDSGQGSGGARQNQHASQPSGGTVSSNIISEDGDVQLELIPGDSEPFHPSTIINQFLLDSNPEAEVAVTHDEIWCSVLHDDDAIFPDEQELIGRIRKKYQVVIESEHAFFVAQNDLSEATGIVVPPNVAKSASAREAPSSPSYTGDYRSQTIEELEEKVSLRARPIDLSVDDLQKSAFRSFTILEPWFLPQTIFEHPLVQSTVRQIREQSLEYVSAMQNSRTIADKGYAFTKDAVDLWGFLTGQSSAEELYTFVESMLQVATSAHKLSKDTSQQFRNIRTKLLQIFGGIPSAIEEVRAQQLAEGQKENDPLTTDINTQPITLPAPLTVEMRLSTGFPTLQDHRTVVSSFGDEMGVLRGADEDIRGLITDVGVFCNWWISMTGDLQYLLTRISQSSRQKFDRLYMVNVKQKWLRVQENFQSYSRTINNIVLLCPRIQSPGVT